jgi:plastocyanin
MRVRSYSRLLGPAAITAAGLAFLTAGQAEAKVVKAQVSSNFFAPGSLAVKQGDKVRFVWEEFSFEAHDVNVRKGPAKFSSPLQAGGTWTTKKLKKPGKYVLFCSQHPEEMTMTLKVKKKR